ncbi:MAG: AbgT family transporter [Bacteroidetes bacterium]|nr:AbgT family transporter [Bacteroidota bacterium]
MNQQIQSNPDKGFVDRCLRGIEVVGNKLPDPSMLFLLLLFVVWILSAFLSNFSFSSVIDPRTGAPLVINNLLSGSAITEFMSQMVSIFTGFAPLGVVLVAMLGVGVADEAGYFNTGIKLLLSKTSVGLLTPVVILVGLLSHSAIDAGYVLVIPLGGIIFHSAGRHPLAGVAAAFAGVSGGFSANPLPSALDPLLQGFTQPAAQILDAAILVNPLCNYFFTTVSSGLIIALGWYITDRLVEPRLQKNTPIDEDAEKSEGMDQISSRESKAFWWATGVMISGLVILILTLIPADSPFRDSSGSLNSFQAPIMQSIVPLIFLLFLIPGVVYGYLARAFKSSKDMVHAMTKAMSGMAYYIVMTFFCAMFVHAFSSSNIGALLALKGAVTLQAFSLPGSVTIIGIILLTAFVNLFVGSASAKWALLAPIFVPMLMQVGISPDLTQAAYRVGDSSSNIITPLMPYFPLVVVYCQRYFKQTGIGTLTSIMIPYSITFLIAWTAFLILYWVLGIPLGFGASYTYPPV